MKGEIAVRYTIRHFDLPLLTFEANMDSADTGLHFIKVYEENRSFLPLNLTVSEDGVERWLRHRAIPKNRAYVDALLSKVGLSLNLRLIVQAERTVERTTEYINFTAAEKMNFQKTCLAIKLISVLSKQDLLDKAKEGEMNKVLDKETKTTLQTVQQAAENGKLLME